MKLVYQCHISIIILQEPACVLLKAGSIRINVWKMCFCGGGVIINHSLHQILDCCQHIDFYLVYTYDRFVVIFIELGISCTDINHSIKKCTNCYKKTDDHCSKSNRDFLLHITVLHVPSLSLLFLSWNIVEFNPYIYYSASTEKS